MAAEQVKQAVYTKTNILRQVASYYREQVQDEFKDMLS
jgi:hypothetical protein